jgi:hypothetical protein
MKNLRIILVALGLIALALPAGAVAKPALSKQNAAKVCRELRTTMHADAFQEAYGKNKSKRNAFGKCVSQTRRVAAQLREQAVDACRAEREADTAAFTTKYGVGKQGKNALVRCIRSQTADDRAALKTAQKTCATERAADPEAFATTYGTNANHRNAFGKCVSQHARELNDTPPAA